MCTATICVASFGILGRVCPADWCPWLCSSDSYGGCCAIDEAHGHAICVAEEAAQRTMATHIHKAV